MTLADVTPVAVPLDPGNPVAVSVPTGVHLLWWCRFTPDVDDGDPSKADQRYEQAQRVDPLLSTLTTSVLVEDELIHLVTELVRPDGGPEIGCWNITEPLSVGRYDTTVTVVVESNSSDALPPYITQPSGTPVSWGDDSMITATFELSVVDAKAESFDQGTDPFWGDRDVYIAETR